MPAADLKDHITVQDPVILPRRNHALIYMYGNRLNKQPLKTTLFTKPNTTDKSSYDEWNENKI